MTHNHAEPIQTQTPNITAEQRARLKELFPEAFTEGKVDFEKLRAAPVFSRDQSPSRLGCGWPWRKDDSVLIFVRRKGGQHG